MMFTSGRNAANTPHFTFGATHGHQGVDSTFKSWPHHLGNGTESCECFFKSSNGASNATLFWDLLKLSSRVSGIPAALHLVRGLPAWVKCSCHPGHPQVSWGSVTQKHAAQAGCCLTPEPREVLRQCLCLHARPLWSKGDVLRPEPSAPGTWMWSSCVLSLNQNFSAECTDGLKEQGVF